MKKSFFILLKEVQEFLRDKGDLSFSLVLPIAIFALMYGAFGGGTQFNGTAFIVNEDPGAEYSTLLIDRLNSYDGLNVETLSPASAERKLERSDVTLVLFIPQGFSEKLAAAQPAELLFKRRGNGGTEGQIVTSLVQATAEKIGQDIQVRANVKNSLSGTDVSPQLIEIAVQQTLAQERASPALTVSETTVGSSPDPVNQFMPGIMTMFVLFAVNLTAQALVDERRKGTLERLLTTRLKISELFTGKFLAYMARGFIQTLILMLLAYAAFQVFTPVSFLAAMVVALLFAASASAVGLIIGSIARTENQATWFAVFFTMLMVMLSGTFVPLTEGTLLDTLSKISINTYANDAFRILITAGGTLAEAKIDLLVLLGVAVIGLLLSRLLFRAGQTGR